MASILDIGLIDFFTPVFVFLLVFAGMYALLLKTKIFGDGKNIAGIDAIIAFVVALIVTLSKPIVNFLIFVLPWFFILILVLVILIFIGKIFGKTDKDVQWAFSYRTKSPAITWILIFSAVIIVIGFMNLGGQELLDQNPEYVEGSEGSNTAVVPADGVTDSNELPQMGEELNTATGKYDKNVLATLIHPKVLGMIVLLLVGLISILLITPSGFSAAK